jgi:O-antigen/teichoic acid export membrane protein
MGGQAGLAVLAFWLIPYIVKKLGPDGYALYSLLGILSSYLILLSLGAGSAAVKYVSEHVGAGDKGALRTVLGASFWMHALGVTLGAVVVLIFRREFATLLKVDPASLDLAIWVMACASIGGMFLALAQYGQSVLQGLQRYDLSTMLSLLQTALFLGSVALLLWCGHGIRAIGVAFVVVYAAISLVAIIAALRLLPVYPAWDFWREADRKPLRDYFIFSVTGFIGLLSWSVIFQWDKLFIGCLLPLSQLTYYMMPSAILQKFWTIPAAIISVAFPMLSELHGAKDDAGVRRFYRRCSELVLWLVVPGFVMLMVLAPQFLTLWLGETFSRYGTWPLRLLAMGYFFYFMGVMPGVAVGGIGRVQYGVKASAAQALLCLFFWTLLIPRFGIVGAAWGFFLASLAVNVSFVFSANRDFFHMSGREYLKDVCMRPFSAGAVLSVITWLVHSWLGSWISFLLGGGLCVAVYIGVGFLLIDQDNYESLKEVLAAFRSRIAVRSGG